jgi:hypothetical protein
MFDAHTFNSLDLGTNFIVLHVRVLTAVEL